MSDTVTYPPYVQPVQHRHITLDPQAAYRWLLEDEDAESFISLDEDNGAFLASVDHLVTSADMANLFGPGVSVTFYIISDTSGVMDGGILAVRTEDMPVGLWLTDLQCSHRDFTDDREATDPIEAAYATLTAVATAVDAVIDRARETK